MVILIPLFNGAINISIGHNNNLFSQVNWLTVTREYFDRLGPVVYAKIIWRFL